MNERANENAAVALPAGGVAEELIPLLRKHLGLPPASDKKGAEKTAAAAVSVAREPEHRAPAPYDRAHPALQRSVVQLVAFDLDPERYGLPIEQVYEILRVTPITRVPDAPGHVCGLMNVRGRLLPIVDVRRLLGLPSIDATKDARVVMAHVQGRVVGLLVDHVSYVLKLGVAAIEPPPADVVGRRAEYVVGVAMHEGRMIIVLDVDLAMGLGG
jgi:purine-binding chemotaxis protein CheW